MSFCTTRPRIGSQYLSQRYPLCTYVPIIDQLFVCRRHRIIGVRFALCQHFFDLGLHLSAFNDVQDHLAHRVFHQGHIQRCAVWSLSGRRRWARKRCGIKRNNDSGAIVVQHRIFGGPWFSRRTSSGESLKSSPQVNVLIGAFNLGSWP